MKLPKIFKQDIQSNNIQLIPLVIIERDDTFSDFSYNTQSIFLSTHDINVKGHVGTSHQSDSFEDGMYFSPLLLDNPVITEKIDVENRKYTISKCTFKISNNTYNGERFSDILRTDSLIGRKINFAYKSINSSFPLVSIYSSTIQIPIPELYDYHNNVSPTFYFGEIRDIKHTNETLTITAEDLSSTYLHQDLPKNSLSNNSSIIEKYRNAKIPMVYGYMPKSPVVVGSNKTMYADSRPINGWFKNIINNPNRYGYPFDNADFGAVFTAIDDHYCCVSDTIWYGLANNQIPDEAKTYFDWGGYENQPQQIEYVDDPIYDTQIARFVENPLLSRKAAQLMVVYKPSKITLKRRDTDVSWSEDPDWFTSLGDGDGGWGANSEQDANGNPMGGDQLTETEFEYMTDDNYQSNHLLAGSDMSLANYSDAMINATFETHQLLHNRWKHSLFRFEIGTEPPISFINRGGISDHGGYGAYWHWISFGHWVMPEQMFKETFDSNSIYTYPKREDGVDNSYSAIQKRYFTDHPSGSDPLQGSVMHFQGKPTDEFLDSFGNPIKLGDIIRFSDFHNDPNYSSMNPEQINWENYESGGKSPLELYNVQLEDQTGTGDYVHDYTSCFARFRNLSNRGMYHIDLGAYGILSDESLTSAGTAGYTNFGFGDNVSYNFNYRASMRGWLPEVNCMSVCDVKMDFNDMYGSIIGRVNVNNDLISHPADIIADIFVNELGYDENRIDQESLNATKDVRSHQNWMFSFTQSEEINSKELIEDIAKSTFIFPRVGLDGLLKFPQIKRYYEQEDLDNSVLIEDSDIIKYSYNLTKRQELRTGTDLKYDYDHQTDNYFGDHDLKDYQGLKIIHQTLVQEEHLDFYGLENIEDNIKEFESKYMRSNSYTDETPDNNSRIGTMRKFEHFSTHHYRNRHLIIKCQLPLKYLNIDVGEYVRFDNLIDGVKAYGIDYTKLEEVNNQYIYPLFLCTSIKKTIEYVELECLQLHHLWFIDDDTSYATPDEVWGILEEDEEEAVIDDSIIIFYSSEAVYNYNTFDLTDGAEYPYETYNDSQFLNIMDEQNEYNFADPNTGIHKLFSTEHFKVRYNVSGSYESITSWNDLLPGDFTTTTAENQNYTILEINHFNDNFNYIYRLKNTQTIIGDPIIIDWELIVNETDSMFDDGQIIAAPYNDSVFPGSQFILKNNTEYTIFYDSPHPIVVTQQPEPPEATASDGDVNNDGTVNILDIMALIDLVMDNAGTQDMTEDEFNTADVDGNGQINILDVMHLLNMIQEQ